MPDVNPPAHDDNGRFHAEIDRLDPHVRPIDNDLDLDQLDERLGAIDTQPARTIDDLDADLPPPPTGQDLERGIDRLDDGLASARPTRTRPTIDRHPPAAARIGTLETQERDGDDRARIREIVERVRVRAAPHASGPGGWEIALGVAGFLVMMTIGGAAALLVFVDRVVAGMRGIS